jgi:cell division transport system ATP-binding protein
MIRFDSITKKYPGTARPALNGISLEVLRGEFVFLVGASGSGKSSCLRLILKEEKPTSGAIHVLGQDLGRISNRKVPFFRRNIGVVFQDFRLLNNKSVYENVAFTLQVIGKSKGFIQEAVPDVLNMVGLSGKGSRLPHELSGGEQQRVAIARAVVNKPQILLADEPTGNLDPVTSAGIMAVLERINAGGTTVLMATHEAAIVDQMQRRVIELINGQLVRDERHGGYGVTTAIPLPDLQQAEAAGTLPSYALTGATSRVAAEAAEAAPTATGARTAVRDPSPQDRPLQMPAAQSAMPSGDRPWAPLTDRNPDATHPPLPPIPPIPQGPAFEGADAAVRSGASEPSLPATAFASEGELTAQDGAVSFPDVREGEPAAPGAAERSFEGAEVRLGDHFAARPAHPVLPQRGEDDLPEHLRLAERLGLRAPGDEKDHEQNVGPTK